MYPVSARFLAALSRSHTSALKVEVRNAGQLLADITQYVQPGGSVSVDETRQIRRTCTLTLGGLPLDLIPENDGDLLHPASGNELFIYRGIKYSDGSTEFAPLGVFRMTKPVITDDGDSVTVAINGQDRSSVISRISWQSPYQVAAGTNLGTAIKTALATRWPSSSGTLVYNFAPTTFTLPATTWGANPGQSTNDPMADFITAAALGGMELFFDVAGNPTMRPIVDPTTASPVASFVEGENCTVTPLSRSLDETKTYNGVQVFCNGTGTAGPFVVTVFATDPATGLLLFPEWGEVPFPINTTAIPVGSQTLTAARAQATAMATAQLQLLLGIFDATDFECLPNPALAEGDGLTLLRARIKVDANYVASAFNIPFDPESAQHITNRPQVSAA